MPPIRRFATPDAALAAIALNDKGADRSWARVRRRDGSVAAGPVLDSNPDQLILGTLSNTGAVRISHTDVSALEIRVAYREREWALAIIAIGLAVGTFALIARNTRILTHTDSTLIFMTMYGAAAAAFPFVLSRTGLGGWLQRWVVVYAEPVTPELSPAAR